MTKTNRSTPHAACDLEAMAVEAAGLLRLKQRLSKGHPTYDAALVKRLGEPEEGVSAEEVKTSLFERLTVLKQLVSHRRPSSVKGALFQLYVAASEASGIRGELSTQITSVDGRALEAFEARAARLSYGVIAFLETTTMDDDLRLLRAWYVAPCWDVAETCQTLMRDGQPQAIAA